MGVVISGTDIGRVSEAVLISEGGQTTQDCITTHTKSPQVSHLPVVQLHMGGWQGIGVEWSEDAKGKDKLRGTKETETQRGI